MFGLFKKSPPKFCVDCKFYQADNHKFVAGLAVCNRRVGEVLSTDLITGGNTTNTHGTFCDWERTVNYNENCGTKAKFFEPKETA
jgi:hypothetical protein